MSEICFWYAAGACSLAPHILLHEVGADFVGIETAVTPAERISPRALTINPKLRVPVLSIDSEIITEVPAIATVISLARRDISVETLSRLPEFTVLCCPDHFMHGCCLWLRYSDDPAAYPDHKRCTFLLRHVDDSGPFAVVIVHAFAAYLHVFFDGNLIGIDLDRDFPSSPLTRPSSASFVATAIEKWIHTVNCAKYPVNKSLNAERG